MRDPRERDGNVYRANWIGCVSEMGSHHRRTPLRLQCDLTHHQPSLDGRTRTRVALEGHLVTGRYVPTTRAPNRRRTRGITPHADVNGWRGIAWHFGREGNLFGHQLVSYN